MLRLITEPFAREFSEGEWSCFPSKQLALASEMGTFNKLPKATELFYTWENK